MSRLGITVDRRFGNVPPIEGAVADLNQVFLDLLANGARAIEDTGRDDGRIEVTTEFGADDVVIEIKDNGCGISPASIPTILDPFLGRQDMQRRPSERSQGRQDMQRRPSERSQGHAAQAIRAVARIRSAGHPRFSAWPFCECRPDLRMR
jgi:light-regulated signal transduction histidine kinase (bacteriophytochrome)